MIKLYKCPVCGSDLQSNNGNYICSNDNCDIMIVDNHIMTMQMIVDLFKDTEDNSEDTQKNEVNNTKMKEVIVMNKTTAEEYSLDSHSEASVVISIASKGSNAAFVLANKVANIKDVLKVQFNDEDSTDEIFG